ncbi:hypothetical protein DFJ74DRAFT_499753 [Hyaloraphidium curvatum]|nr:hypothetical protein DFJ74DRAFT_499753 [Hyaloraphidium curvatum]
MGTSARPVARGAGTADMNDSRAAPRTPAAPRRRRHRTRLLPLLPLLAAVAALAAGAAASASNPLPADERAAAVREIIAKLDSAVRSPDGCPANCGMVRDAFASGRCVNGECVCMPGWTGDSCTIIDGEPPIPAGGCDPRCGTGVFWKTGSCNPETASCVCEEGWEGDFCGLNPERPLVGGLLNDLPATKILPGKDNAGLTTQTKTTTTTNGGGTNTVQPTNGCPYYPVATGSPMKCGPANGNQRCPDGLCCSSYGYCGGRLRSYVPLSAKKPSRNAKRWYVPDDLDMRDGALVERSEGGETSWDLELYDAPPSPTALGKRQAGPEPDDNSPFADGEGRRAYCYGARGFSDAASEGVWVFRRTAWEKRNCARLSLAKRTNACARNNVCCTGNVCKRWGLEERTNSCKRKRNNDGGSGCCTTTNLPPCPTTPPQAYCDDGCQPNFGKCQSAVASCTGITVLPTKTADPGAPSTTTTRNTVTLNLATTTTQTAQALTGTSTTTKAGTSTSTATVVPATNDIFGTLFQITTGNISKPYQVDKILSLVNLAPAVKAILQGQNPAFPNVTFFAVINEGFTLPTATGDQGLPTSTTAARGTGTTTAVRITGTTTAARTTTRGTGAAGTTTASLTLSEDSATDGGTTDEGTGDTTDGGTTDEGTGDTTDGSGDGTTDGGEEAAGRRLFGRQTTTEPTAAQHPGDVLRYEIVQAYIDPATLPGKVLAPTLLNASFTLAKVNPQYLVITKSGLGIFPFFGFLNTTVIDTVPATNGIIFITRTLVVPPVWPTTTMTQANLTSFVSLLANGSLTNTVNNYGQTAQPGATFFVPVNDAFTTEEAVAILTGASAEEQASIANFMIVVSGNGVYYSSDLTDGLELQSVNGQNLQIAVIDGTVTVNGANCIILDILTSNGVIHVIDALLIPDNIGARRNRADGVVRAPAASAAQLRSYGERSGMNRRAEVIPPYTWAGQGILNAGPIGSAKGKDTSPLWDASAGGEQ